MPKQLLNRPQVVAVFEQMRGEAVTERVAACNTSHQELNLCPSAFSVAQ
jgi:hypothetical protein